MLCDRRRGLMRCDGSTFLWFGCVLVCQRGGGGCGFGPTPTSPSFHRRAYASAVAPPRSRKRRGGALRPSGIINPSLSLVWLPTLLNAASPGAGVNALDVNITSTARSIQGLLGTMSTCSVEDSSLSTAVHSQPQRRAGVWYSPPPPSLSAPAPLPLLPGDIAPEPSEPQRHQTSFIKRLMPRGMNPQICRAGPRGRLLR